MMNYHFRNDEEFYQLESKMVVLKMGKHNKTSKWIFTIGIFLFALGFAFNHGTDTTESYTYFSKPLIVLGLIVVIVSNFLKTKSRR
ncbi:hypothetical protein WMZ97_13455 [Lentibacillus sp. N15]